MELDMDVRGVGVQVILGIRLHPGFAVGF